MILFLPKLLRIGLRVLLLLLVALIVYLIVTAVQVYQASTRDEAAPAQAIVVLGAAQYNGRPSPDLAARLDHAFSLWQHGYAQLVALTGGRQPGDRFTEAEAGRTYLESKGIPAADLLADDTGSNSWQSLASVAGQLESRGDLKVILVSDPFHDARIAAMASELGLHGVVSPTRTSPIKGTSTLPYFAKETIAMAVGRVIGFSRLSGVSAPAAGF